MSTRRIAALDTLERLRRYEIEADSRALGELRATEADLKRQHAALHDKMIAGTQTDDPALLGYIGEFVRSLRREMNRIDRQRAELAPQIDDLDTRVGAVFREIKTYELLRQTALARIVAETERAEQAEASEIALIKWWREQQSDG